MPLMYHSNSFGTLYADLKISGSLKSVVLDDEIQIIPLNDSFQINTSASVFVKSAGAVTLGLGYSRPIWHSQNGLLHAGLKVNISQYELATNIIALAGLEDGENIGDAIENDYEANSNSSTSLGIDAGLVWISEHFNAGFTLTDINEPEYEYGSLVASVDECQALIGVSLDNCFVAQEEISRGRINGDEVFVANAQATVSASAWTGEDIRWGFHTSLDLNEKNDALGDVYQWANASTTIELNNWLLPELRLGYTKNLSGTELGYYSVGLTFLKQAELDVRWSDESVVIDGSSAPRSAYFSFAIQSKF
jgi:hypothetical protein